MSPPDQTSSHRSVPSAQVPLHLCHLYHQVVEFSHAVLSLGWTSSTRIWTSVMSIVAAALRHHDMRTLLYVDDLLITCSSFTEATRSRQIIEDTLLAVGIVRAPLKGCFDTPTQTLTDHLDCIISSIGKGVLRVPERICFALRLNCSISALSPPRDIQHVRAVQAQVLPVTSRC